MKISIQGLCFGYKQRQVLRGVDLEVPSGSLCALLGANGAGKTTLLKCINGILRPQSGRVFADDTDLGSLTARERARLIGYVPQNAQAGGSCLNVLETVLVSYPISWSVTSILYIIYYARGNWLRRGIQKAGHEMPEALKQ